MEWRKRFLEAPLLGSPHRLHLHAFPRCRGPHDGRDYLVAPDGVSEVRNGVSPVLDVCRERGVGTPDVVGGRSFQAGERGPFLPQRRRDRKLGGLAPPPGSRGGQGVGFGGGGVSGNPERSVGSLYFPQKTGIDSPTMVVDRTSPTYPSRSSS